MIVHYTIRDDEVVNGRVLVQAVLYCDTIFASGPVSPLTGRRYNPLGIGIEWRGLCGPRNLDRAYVGPPTWWERRRGITWAAKIERARERVERWAKKQLARDMAALEVLE